MLTIQTTILKERKYVIINFLIIIQEYMRINEDGYEEQDQIEIPSLSNVVLVGGPRTESEWILVLSLIHI